MYIIKSTIILTNRVMAIIHVYQDGYIMIL